MKPVVQLERTGCGIASVAALVGLSYLRAKSIANSLGIFAHDEGLWSETAQVRKLLTTLVLKRVLAKFHFVRGKRYRTLLFCQ